MSPTNPVVVVSFSEIVLSCSDSFDGFSVPISSLVDTVVISVSLLSSSSSPCCGTISISESVAPSADSVVWSVFPSSSTPESVASLFSSMSSREPCCGTISASESGTMSPSIPAVVVSISDTSELSMLSFSSSADSIVTFVPSISSSSDPCCGTVSSSFTSYSRSESINEAPVEVSISALVISVMPSSLSLDSVVKTLLSSDSMLKTVVTSSC